MARHAEGPRLYEHGQSGHWIVRFTYRGKRYCVSTGTRDRRKAEEKKGQIYADIVAGRRKRAVAVSAALTPLADVIGEWLSDIEVRIDHATYVMYESYAGRFQERFPTLADFTEASIADYRRDRLKEVKRTSLIKELSAMRQFLAWAKEQGLLDTVPVVESPPKHVLGTPDTKRRHKAKALKLTPAEAAAIIERLPEMSTANPKSRVEYRVKDPVLFAWETGLRPVTIGKLNVPEHWRPGRRELTLERSIDKARFERVLPLTDAAVAALERCAPRTEDGRQGEGPIFGRHRYDRHIAQAAMKASLAGLMERVRAESVSIYDFRHGRTTHMASNTQNLAAVAYLVGHRHVSTTAKYVESNKDAAADVLRQLQPKTEPPSPQSKTDLDDSG